MSEHGLDLIIIDYLQLIGTTSNYINPVQQYTEISKAIKIIARELNVPVLALSQLSRSVEQRIPPVPKLSDLRETGSIEQDADVVMLLYREDRYRKTTENTNVAEVIIAKHRNGATGSIKLYFEDKQASFRNLSNTNISDGTENPDENLDYNSFVQPNTNSEYGPAVEIVEENDNDADIEIEFSDSNN
jgi:replicative DNA helicase